MPEPYVLPRGEDGAERLRLLNRLKGPSTMALLRRVGLRPGWRCLDVGCGIGAVTLAMARRVGPTGQVTGLDLDPGFIAIAAAEAARQGLAVDFRVADIATLDLAAGFDLVFSRYLLSHLPDPEDKLARLVAAVAPGGLLVVEDVDFPGSICHPPNAGFDAYVWFYNEVVRANGGDPELGRRLGVLLGEAGLQGVQLAVAQPVFVTGPGKRLAAVTLSHLRERILHAGVASAETVDAAVAGLEEFAAQPGSMLTMSRTFQAWGRRPTIGAAG
jgi:SAM-dependent methyltransferase